MPWGNENELKQDSHSYEDRYKEDEGDILCNIKKQPYLDINYEELQNFNFVQSDEEFSMINPNLLDVDLEDSDVINATAVSTIN